MHQLEMAPPTTEVFVREWTNPGECLITRYRTDGSRVGEYLAKDGTWHAVPEYGVLPTEVFVKLMKE